MIQVSARTRGYFLTFTFRRSPLWIPTYPKSSPTGITAWTDAANHGSAPLYGVSRFMIRTTQPALRGRRFHQNMRDLLPSTHPWLIIPRG